MAVVNLHKVRSKKAERIIPVSYAAQTIDGEEYREPFFDLDDFGEPQDYGFDDEPRDPTEAEFAGANFCYNVSPAEFTETAIMIADAGKTVNFSFEERPYLRRIYDTAEQKTLLKCGRQVEKSQHFQAHISMEDGSVKELQRVEVGDRVVGLAPDGAHTEVGEVTWKSRKYTKPCVKITTRQGHSTIVALTHPMRSWGSWDEAEKFEVGHRLAVVRRGGEFLEKVIEDDRWIIIAAGMVAEGNTCGTPDFTQSEGPLLDEFLDALDFLGIWYNTHEKESKGGLCWQIKFVQSEEGEINPVKDRLVEWRIDEEKSAEKHVPNFVWKLGPRQTALFLNRLWAGDGHASLRGSSYHLEYDTTSERLARDVQRLLWKFGIPSSFRGWKPALYKHTKKWAYKIRVETQEGALRFITQVGALGKTEELPLIGMEDNSNRDVYPKTISEDIKTIHRSRWRYQRRGRYVPQPSLRSAGLREKPKYNLSRRKLGEYIDFFRSDKEFDQDRVDALAAHLDTDLFWDEIISIEDVGEQPCCDITVRGTDSFVGDGFVTHNSTTLGNKMIGYSCLNNHFRSLFVAPSAEQAKVFSNDRVRDPIDMSPLVQAYTNSALTNAVFHKKFINYSQIRLRYAYLTADRVRGIPADLITIDEIQDILVDNIPVIEECASHSHWKLFIYSGTPKSLDNTLEHYWANFSTQNEWLVPCERHGTPKNPASWHWNVLDEDNIGKTGLMCDKCHEPINPYHPMAQWAAMNPQNEANKDKVTFEGFRIPQLMVPWIVNTEEGWSEILQKQERYSRQKLYNEVLGISYDSGTRPLTRGQLKACCKEHIRLGDFESFKKYAQGNDIFAGIDWGCHDEETRILTQDGWKFFRDLMDDDLVAQWDADTRVMSLVKPEVRTIKDWDGPLHHFETRGGLDMMLTGTHRMRVGNQCGTGWVTEPADQTVQRGGNIKFVGHVDWEGEEQETFTLPGLPKSPGYQGCEPITFMMDDWLEFLGYILSEGGVCLKENAAGDLIPYHLKMSQRESVSAGKAEKIKSCMDRMRIPYSEFPNPETGDLNWSINGKQFWHWFAENMGHPGDQKRIPRQFLSLSRRQLQILFDAMVLGDGYIDGRTGCDSGAYYSTSKGLCEDFQEVCIRIGRRCLVRLHKPAEGQRKTRWRAMWSSGRDYQLNTPNQRVKQISYKGKVYCCKVPSGYIVTERNGCVAYQGNTGENTYTVISLGAYLGTGNFTIFWTHRFTGRELEPPIQLDRITSILAQYNVQICGCDYGGGFDRNDHLIRAFGPNKILKYQYNPQQKKGKVYYEEKLHRFAVHRTEVMSDIFNAIIRKQFDFPCWEDFNDPYGQDILNIFSEKNERMRMTEYKHAPGTTDDTFHSIVYCFLASMIKYPRPDIIAPLKDTGEDFNPRRRR